jgi:RNA polymerase sigma-70 factor (ECF subfamily)
MREKTGEVNQHEALLHALTGRYRESFRRYFYRHVRDHAEAEDLTQELFFRVVRKADLDNVANPEGFLFRAAANLLRDRGRRNRTSTAFIAEITAAAAENVEVLSPERVLNSKQSLQIVLKALNSFDGRSRDIFILHRMEGMKYSEIAAYLGISVSSVEKHMIKCIAKLTKFANICQE